MAKEQKKTVVKDINTKGGYVGSVYMKRATALIYGQALADFLPHYIAKLTNAESKLSSGQKQYILDLEEKRDAALQIAHYSE
jgi:hypothetical protein